MEKLWGGGAASLDVHFCIMLRIIVNSWESYFCKLRNAASIFWKIFCLYRSDSTMCRLQALASGGFFSRVCQNDFFKGGKSGEI